MKNKLLIYLATLGPMGRLPAPGNPPKIVCIKEWAHLLLITLPSIIGDFTIAKQFTESKIFKILKFAEEGVQFYIYAERTA